MTASGRSTTAHATAPGCGATWRCAATARRCARTAGAGPPPPAEPQTRALWARSSARPRGQQAGEERHREQQAAELDEAQLERVRVAVAQRAEEDRAGDGHAD